MEYFKEEKFRPNNDLIYRVYYKSDKGKLIDWQADYEERMDIVEIFGFSEPDHWIKEDFGRVDENIMGFEKMMEQGNMTKTVDGYFLEILGKQLYEDAHNIPFDSVKTFNIIEKYFYSSNKQLLKYQKFIKYYKSESLMVEMEYKYDDFGNRVYYREYLFDDQYNNNSKYTFEKYNLKNGKELYLLKTYAQNEDIIIDYFYNSFGDVIVELSKFLDNNRRIENLNIQFYEYHYDDKKRWIEKIAFEHQNMEFRYERKYDDYSNFFL